jgi:hypothetical protein
MSENEGEMYVCLFLWYLTPLSTIFQLYHGVSENDFFLKLGLYP